MNSVLFISGPTASGKTDFSLELAKLIPSEVINADMGQFYKPLSIGTAKPDWKNTAVPHHLFDIIDEPNDLTVVKYNQLVKLKIKEIWNKNKLPMIVGGSLFYIKSLYYPPKKLPTKNHSPIKGDPFENEITMWDMLYKIDPERAKKIHPNDIYRIQRALNIWQKTGRKPSEYKPDFNPYFNSSFVFIEPPLKILKKRIHDRTINMIKQENWISEAEGLMGTLWEDFIQKKGFIGYSEIFDWIKKGKKLKDFDLLIKNIVSQTFNYAKRQITFWNHFKKLLINQAENSKFFCKVIEIQDVDFEHVKLIDKYVNKIFLQK
ncbi:tRNA (adenosine(37)-N6)-dimethylallyltransferase MiaA [Candidatus Dependentiae bacterium]|nr:tRNA (adenosine(37)-N6)-dimethylallyltransferase MiaA [Candidatus Dependentiae bacterium]